MIKNNVFLRPKFASGSAVATRYTGNVTILLNLFGVNLSPDSLDALTMEKREKYTGPWSVLVEKLRFLRCVQGSCFTLEVC